MLKWDGAVHALDVPEMDATHREFLELLAALDSSGEQEFVSRLDRLIEHTRLHFDNESRLMRSCGFPAIAEHEGEHRRVLGLLDHLRRGCDRGRQVFARDYAAKGMPEWFAQHLSTMDACLAACWRRRSG